MSEKENDDRDAHLQVVELMGRTGGKTYTLIQHFLDSDSPYIVIFCFNRARARELAKQLRARNLPCSVNVRMSRAFEKPQWAVALIKEKSR